MSEWVTLDAGQTVGNCPDCGIVTGDDVDEDGVETGFDCGQCGQFTPNRPVTLDEPLDVHRDSLADPPAVAGGGA